MVNALAITILMCLGINADIYFHNPRGSNNRMDESTRERRNNKRMFDSQNNNRGGYNVGSLYYYTGSVLSLEWTNQHSCSEQNSHCEIIIQYMCDDKLRDGIITTTIPDKLNQCDGNDCNSDLKYGMHENRDYFMNCYYRYRNKGLFTVNPIKNNQGATRTRQNPAGTRYGYECPEERDYYPYWHPSPWRDIAVMTNNVSKCEMYQQESQNTKSRFLCTPVSGYIEGMVNRRIRPKLLPTNKEECEKMEYPVGSNNTFRWVETKPFGDPPPACILGPRNRDNHLGNGVGGFPNMFNWTIPNTPHEHCALRIRYNISTGDYDAWNGNYSSSVDIGQLVGIDDKEEAEARGYIFKDKPQVQPLKKIIKGKDIGRKLKLQLAINTNQYGRTFQDRSHSFSIRKRPAELKKSKIHNINVRGKRGNIVQVYPSVEYDYVPNRVMSSIDDHVHFQWTGSNTNNRNNDGQGLAGTDRSNVALLRPQNYPEGTLVPPGHEFGHWGNNYPAHLDNVTFLGLSRTDLESLLILSPGQLRGELSELDDAGTYYDLGPRKITRAGIYYYMCTRNNNFSNRSQKGKIVVSKFKFSTAVIGWSGGKVILDEGEQGVWVSKGAVRESKVIHVEQWNEEDGRKIVASKGGYIKVGKNYESNFLVVYPFDDLIGGNEVTVKITVSDEDVVIYHSLDYLHWRKMKGVKVTGSSAAFHATKGGIYVARKSGGQPTLVIAIIVVLLIVAGLVIGTILYCRKKSKTPKSVLNDISNNMKGKV